MTLSATQYVWRVRLLPHGPKTLLGEKETFSKKSARIGHRVSDRRVFSDRAAWGRLRSNRGIFIERSLDQLARMFRCLTRRRPLSQRNSARTIHAQNGHFLVRGRHKSRALKKMRRIAVLWTARGTLRSSLLSTARQNDLLICQPTITRVRYFTNRR